jgi:hypothetical protein
MILAKLAQTAPLPPCLRRDFWNQELGRNNAGVGLNDRARAATA